MNSRRIARVLVAGAFASMAFGILAVGPAEADPYNPGDIVSGCTYCHTGRTPQPQPKPEPAPKPDPDTKEPKDDEAPDPRAGCDQLGDCPLVD